MKIFRSHFVALGLAAAALSSCSRSSYYPFQSKAPAYLGSVPVAAAPVAPPAAASEPATAVSAVVSAAPAAAPLLAREAAPAPLPAATEPAVATTSAVAAAPAKAAKLPLVQRVALHRVLKQAATAVARQQNTASVTHTAAAKDSSKSGFIVAVVGLISLIIGIVAGSGFLITLGVILLIIGAALYFLKLL